MAKTKGKHGGKREGAGRKVVNPEGKVVNVSFSVPEPMLARLDEICTRDGLNRSQVVTELLRTWLKRKLKAQA